jgi:hypothetical protein
MFILQAPVGNNLQPAFLIVCTIGIAVAILVPPIWLFLHKPPPRTQYRLVVMLVLFALAAIMALLFGSHGDSLTTSTSRLAIQITGPFAAFLGAYIVILKFFDYEEEPTMETSEHILRQVTRLIEATEDKCEWIGYEHWRRDLDGFEEINGQQEENFLRNILGGAYSPSESVKVANTRIATAFLYLSNSVLKIQRVEGTTTDTPTKIRFRSHSSYGLSKGMRSVILISTAAIPGTPLRVRRALTDLDPPSQVPDGYARIDTKTFDCLILTQYSEFPKHEDYLLVDVSRFSSENSADMSFAVVSTDRSIKEPDFWQMRRATVSTESRLPLSFRRFRSTPRSGWKDVLRQLNPWLEVLDEYDTREENVSTALRSMREAIVAGMPEHEGTDMKFGEMVRFLTNSDSYNFHARKGSDTMLVLFTWA